jgi:hypothetical protein
VKLGNTTLTMAPATPFGLSAQGSFSGESFVVPNVAVGSYTVTVTDSGGKTATAPLNVTT